MRIIILETDVFPDKQLMGEALACLEEDTVTHRVSRHDLRGRTPTEHEWWDTLLDAMLAADLIVTV